MYTPALACFWGAMGAGSLCSFGSFWAHSLASLGLSFFILHVCCVLSVWTWHTVGAGRGEVPPPPRPSHHSPVHRLPLLCLHGASFILSAHEHLWGTSWVPCGALGLQGEWAREAALPVQVEGRSRDASWDRPREPEDSPTWTRAGSGGTRFSCRLPH